MKKRIAACVSVVLVVLCFVGVFAVRSSKVVGEEGLVAKARKEINLAQADTIEMVIAGKSTVNQHTLVLVCHG